METRLPLKDITVLDLSRLLPGSLCGQMLADLGADVIKVEDSEGGDSFRWSPPRYDSLSGYFHMLNRNKRSLKVNLKTVPGKEIFLRMAERADVLLETFRPGAMKRLGLDYETLQAINPRLIYCSLTGFGQTGPYAQRSSHDINLLSLSGVLDLIGEKTGSPVIPAIQVAGVGGGALHTCIGILAGLIGRQASGRGMYLDVAILDGITPFLSMPMAEYLATGVVPQRGQYVVGGGYAFYNVYKTADDKYLTLGCLENKFWSNFCQAVGRPDLIEQQFVDHPEQEKVIAAVAEIIRQKKRDEWTALLAEHDVCFAPVNDLADVWKDPHIQHRGLWFRTEHPEDGRVGQQAFPVLFDQERPPVCRPAPGYGQHSRELLREYNWTEQEIDSFEKQGII